MKVKFKKLTESAIMPTKATAGSAAYDLYADSDTIVLPGRSAISTGIAIELPYGYLADVRPRSGYSLKGFAGNDSARFDCDVLLGTIDSDYRGNIKGLYKVVSLFLKTKICQKKRILPKLGQVPSDYGQALSGRSRFSLRSAP